jgi:death-on-curing family protein
MAVVPPETLTRDEVVRIYDRLIDDFASSGDPLSPAGIRDEGLLESAIGRQHTGIGTHVKYPSVHQNAATLLYGICHDHPFVNGNKRTALVSMLAHLDKNRFTLRTIGKDELFQMILEVSNHTFEARRSRRPRVITRVDDEVVEIAAWIERHMYRMMRGERQITYRQLRRILGHHRHILDNPNGGTIELLRVEQHIETRLFRSAIVTNQHKRLTSIPYRGENGFVPIQAIKTVRKQCGLTEADGFDSFGFYDSGSNTDTIDGFINEYRTVLRRLASK